VPPQRPRDFRFLDVRPPPDVIIPVPLDPRAKPMAPTAHYPADQEPAIAARAALPAARAEKHEFVDDQPSDNSDACGGARAPSEAVGASSSPGSRRCARIRPMSSGSSMLAATFRRRRKAERAKPLR
jgi:hypothetical protein